MSVANGKVFVSLISTSLAVLKILLNELLDNSTYKVSLVPRASTRLWPELSSIQACHGDSQNLW